jgi:hypothetical protein
VFELSLQGQYLGCDLYIDLCWEHKLRRTIVKPIGVYTT